MINKNSYRNLYLLIFKISFFCSALLWFSCSNNNQEAYEAHKKVNEQFLKDNATKEGVKTLPSGLQYIVLKEGYGPSPETTESVTVHYHGTLIDGTVFDSSVEKGKPLTFDVNQVIPGWQEALQLMPQGAKWRVFIPAHLGYGQRGAGSKIKPNSVLIFDMELISING
jgi:FKBP-type peptidyl-prolyl cis-trans isomerase FklB